MVDDDATLGSQSTPRPHKIYLQVPEWSQAKPYHHIRHIHNYYLLAGTFVNQYHAPLEMTIKTFALARQVKEKLDDVHGLQQYLDVLRIRRRHGTLITLTADHWEAFTQLNNEYLPALTMGYIK